MSTLLDLTNNVLAYGFSSARYLDDVQRWINEAQVVVARQINLPTETTSVDITTTLNDNSYELPSNFARIINIFQGAEEDVLEELSVDDFDETDKTETAEPIYYIVIGNTLYLSPTPNATYTFTLRYYKLPSTMGATDSPEISSEYEHLLETYALSKAFRRESDFEASMFYRNQFMEDLRRIQGEIQGNTNKSGSQVKGTWHNFPAHYE
jgi:hypothetical protein